MVKYVEAVNDNDWHPKFLKDMDRMDTMMKCVFLKKKHNHLYYYYYYYYLPYM